MNRLHVYRSCVRNPKWLTQAGVRGGILFAMFLNKNVIVTRAGNNVICNIRFRQDKKENGSYRYSKINGGVSGLESFRNLMKSITPSPRPPFRYATSIFSCSALDNASTSTLSWKK